MLSTRILDFEVSLRDNQQGQHESKMKYLGKSVEDCGSPEKHVADLLGRHKPRLAQPVSQGVFAWDAGSDGEGSQEAGGRLLTVLLDFSQDLSLCD